MNDNLKNIEYKEIYIRYGGFWRRFFAAIADMVIVLILSSPFILFVALIAPFGSVLTTLILTVDWLYSSLMTSSSHQATVGKMLLGIIVTNEDYKRLSWAEATLRYMCSNLSYLSFFIGYLMVAIHPKKQGLHDLLARTYVVKKSSSTLTVKGAENA